MRFKTKEFIPILGLILLFLFLRIFVFDIVQISGHSMDPTLENNQRIIVLKFNQTEFKRFDIVTLKKPNEKKIIIKRIIGLPGDEIEMNNDILKINGKEYTENYLNEYKNMLKNGTLKNMYTFDENYMSLAENTNYFNTQNYKVKVPSNQYFILGDNRLISDDSRYFGYIEKKDIIGKPIFSFWPIKRVGPI